MDVVDLQMTTDEWPWFLVEFLRFEHRMRCLMQGCCYPTEAATECMYCGLARGGPAVYGKSPIGIVNAMKRDDPQ